MDWIERLNCAVGYMEDHLEEEIDYEQVAKIACCSSYHFQRMFSYLANVPLSTYLRRRRMTRAAEDLQNGEDKVLDVAIKYGYDSPTAFNRAFQSVHGVTPSQAKQDGVTLKAFPPISFKMTIKGDVEMNYRIENKEAFRIIGLAEPLSEDQEQNFMVVPGMWQRFTQNRYLEQLLPKMDGTIQGVLGVSSCNQKGNWKYYIAVASNQAVEEPFEELTISAQTWAVFEGEGTMPKSIQELELKIVTEWLPTSAYEYANAPDVERYLNADPQNAKFEVWIPVIRKGEA